MWTRQERQQVATSTFNQFHDCLPWNNVQLLAHTCCSVLFCSVCTKYHNFNLNSSQFVEHASHLICDIRICLVEHNVSLITRPNRVKKTNIYKHLSPPPLLREQTVEHARRHVLSWAEVEMLAHWGDLESQSVTEPKKKKLQIIVEFFMKTDLTV